MTKLLLIVRRTTNKMSNDTGEHLLQPIFPNSFWSPSSW